MNLQRKIKGPLVLIKYLFFSFVNPWSLLLATFLVSLAIQRGKGELFSMSVILGDSFGKWIYCSLILPSIYDLFGDGIQESHWPYLATPLTLIPCILMSYVIYPLERKISETPYLYCLRLLTIYLKSQKIYIYPAIVGISFSLVFEFIGYQLRGEYFSIIAIFLPLVFPFIAIILTLFVWRKFKTDVYPHLNSITWKKCPECHNEWMGDNEMIKCPYCE